MKLLSYPDLKPVKGIRYSRVHVDRLEKAGQFPTRIRLSKQYVAWREEDIDAWLEKRATIGAMVNG